VTVLGAALTEVRITGLLEAIKKVLVGVPVVATRVAAFPGAQLFSWRTLTMLAIARVAPVSATKICRGVAALAT
jgi:hypothetical protein